MERKVLNEDHLVHGTYDGYFNHGCRCIPCTRAFAKTYREMQARRAEKTPCSVEGCQNGLYAKGVCKPHYERRRTGIPDFPLPKKKYSAGRYPSKDRVGV